MATVAAVRARRLILADVLSFGRRPRGDAPPSPRPPIHAAATRPPEPRTARQATQHPAQQATQRPAMDGAQRAPREGSQRAAGQPSRDSADGRAPK
jgi:hypothetical protein